MANPAEAIGAQTYTGGQDHSKDFIAVVVSRFNSKVTDALYQGCEETLKHYGVTKIVRFDVPGAYELPQAAAHLAGKAKFDAIITLGCVITGETKHNEYISHAVASGLMNLSFMSRRPVIFGVLTPDTEEQAIARSGGEHGNKGSESAVAALQMIDLWRSSTDVLKDAEHGAGKPTIGFGQR